MKASVQVTMAAKLITESEIEFMTKIRRYH